jgi:hypothetical protein
MSGCGFVFSANAKRPEPNGGSHRAQIRTDTNPDHMFINALSSGPPGRCSIEVSKALSQ